MDALSSGWAWLVLLAVLGMLASAGCVTLVLLTKVLASEREVRILGSGGSLATDRHRRQGALPQCPIWTLTVRGHAGRPARVVRRAGR